MVADYIEYDGYKIFKSGVADPKKKTYLFPDDPFIRSLHNIGYTILDYDCEFGDGDPIGPIYISKTLDKHGVGCVIYNKDRISFRTNDVNLLKLVYVFVNYANPTLDDYEEFLLTPKLPFITKDSFISELKKETLNTNERDEQNGKFRRIDVLADLYGTCRLSRVGFIFAYDVARFEMFVYDSELLMLLFQYSLTPLDKR